MVMRMARMSPSRSCFLPCICKSKTIVALFHPPDADIANICLSSVFLPEADYATFDSCLVDG